jgi:uncharacterized protein YbcI
MRQNLDWHMSGVDTSVAHSPAALISNRLVKLYASYLGRGPNRARTTLSASTALVVFSESMTRAEQTLAEAGNVDTVQAMRSALRAAMRDEAVAAVEEITGRRVVGFLGGLDIDANLAALVFMFAEREPASELTEPVDSA